jgi:hypothetical protein
VGSVWAVLAQRQQLEILRADRRTLAMSKDANVVPPSDSQDQAVPQSVGTASEELLRLRNEVTQLNARKRGLAGVTEENVRLRSQLESTRTNASANLPAGYIRKAQARFAGYSTPENTFQSFLSALRDHDMTLFLQSLTPGAAQKLQARFQDPTQAAEFFKNMDAMPGLAIQNRKDQPDGSVQFEVEVVPGMPKETMNVQLIDGQWKLDPPF